MAAITQEIIEQKKRGVLLVLTGPTGAGKDALFAKLQEKNPTFGRVITTTSREMRPDEQEENPYYFISREKFEAMIAAGAFFEWVEFRGHLYGTQKETLEKELAKNADVLWHIDAKGVKNIKERVKQLFPRSVFVFLAAPDVTSLEQRVQKDEGKVIHRWNKDLVSWELDQYDDCDYLVVNHDKALDQAVEQVLCVIEAKRLEIMKENPQSA